MLDTVPSPKLMAFLAARTISLSPSLKPFECAELLESWLEMGLRQEAEQLLRHLAEPLGSSSSSGGGSSSGSSGNSFEGSASSDDSVPSGDDSSPAAPSQLQEQQQQQQQQSSSSQSPLEVAAAKAALPSVVRLLLAMATVGCYPEPAFNQVRMDGCC
jgi:hypothetical protein